MTRENRCQERIDASINHEIHFAWQARYLVKLQRHFSWQAHQFVKFWEIAGARNVVSFHTKCVSKMGRVRSPNWRARNDDLIVGYPRNIVGYPREIRRIVFISAEAIQGVSAEILSLNISWQAQYSVKLEGDFNCSVYCT